MKYWLGCSLAILIQISLSNQCGVTTHTAIGHKALNWLDTNFQYYNAISNNLDIYYSSLMFPDWGYNCIIGSDNLHMASETAHWLPFQLEAIKYIHDKYPQPWNESANALITFIFGIMSHSVADIIWHNLNIINNINQGFIEALANSDYNYTGNGYNRDIHDLADVGGEFMTSMLFDLEYLDTNRLKFITIYDDIVNIYKRMNINITTLDLLICMDELYLETEFIRRIPSDIIYPYYSIRAPFLTDYYLDWWLGGINSLSIWTQRCWIKLTTMINNNTDNACYIYQDSIRTKYHPSKASAILKNIYYKPKKTNNCQLYQNYTVFRLKEKYAYLGSAITTCDINNDGHDEIIIGAPGKNNRGGVYVLYYNTSWPKEVYLEPNDSNIIFIPYNGSIGSQFGGSLTCTDVNKDGYADIIIGIPNYDTMEINNNGQIQIFYGNKNKLFKPDITINTNVLYAIMGIKIYSDNDNILLGNYLTNVGDNLNQGQLIIMPKSKYSTNINCTINGCTDNLSVINLPKNYWGWSGYKVIIWEKYLIIGEPLYNGIGRIYCYLNNTVVWQITGYNNSRLGFDFIIINDTLIVSSPHNSIKNYYGAVYFIQLHELFNKKYHAVNEPIIKKIIYADQPNTRFGWTLSHNKDTIIIGEPNYNTSEGAVHIGDKCYTFHNKRSYFGRSILMTKYGLLVSALTESVISEHAGAVYLLKN